MQVNALADGGTLNCGSGGCNYVWWVQGFADIGHNNGGSIGAWVEDAGIEVWNNLNGPLFCYLYPSPLPNINGTGDDVQEEFFLTDSTHVTNALTVTGSSSYSNSMKCPLPNSWSYNYLNKVEGVIVGYGGGEHASFTPLQSELFYGYIDLISDYNKMSSVYPSTTQTGETSNLYQVVNSYFGETYNTQYLYTVMFNEDTQTST